MAWKHLTIPIKAILYNRLFDGTASNLGLNSGIVMSTGDISILDPNFAGFGDFIDVNPPVTDPDLLDVANSVPALIGQNFVVQDINDVAVLEFDFIPSSDTVTFNMFLLRKNILLLKTLSITMYLVSLFQGLV